MNNYIIEFDYAALVIYIILLFFYYPKSSTGGTAGRSFKKLISVSASATLLDILTVYVGYSTSFCARRTSCRMFSSCTQGHLSVSRKVPVSLCT